VLSTPLLVARFEPWLSVRRLVNTTVIPVAIIGHYVGLGEVGVCRGGSGLALIIRFDC